MGEPGASIGKDGLPIEPDKVTPPAGDPTPTLTAAEIAEIQRKNKELEQEVRDKDQKLQDEQTARATVEARLNTSAYNSPVATQPGGQVNLSPEFSAKITEAMAEEQANPGAGIKKLGDAFGSELSRFKNQVVDEASQTVAVTTENQRYVDKMMGTYPHLKNYEKFVAPRAQQFMSMVDVNGRPQYPTFQSAVNAVVKEFNGMRQVDIETEVKKRTAAPPNPNPAPPGARGEGGGEPSPKPATPEPIPSEEDEIKERQRLLRARAGRR